MKTLLNFKFNATQSLKVCVEEPEQKENLYYEPTNEIHKFDVVTIAYVDGKSKTQLFVDILQEAVCLLDAIFTRALENKLQLTNNLQAGRVGEAFNQFLINGNEEDAYNLLFSYALPSAEKCKFSMYQISENIYIEVFDAVARLYDDIDINTRNDYLKNPYKPIAFIKIEPDQIAEWHQLCKDLMKKLDIE